MHSRVIGWQGKSVGFLVLAIVSIVATRPGLAQGVKVSTHSDRDMWNVFRGHDRVPLDPARFPAVGKLMFQVGGHGMASCTGTLIGKRLVLTAAHCFAPTVEYNREIEAQGLEDEARPRHVYFLPDFKNGQLPAGTKPVASVIGDGWMGQWSQNHAANHNDWAVIKLEEQPTSRALPDFGALPVSKEPLREGLSLIAVGYSGDYQKGETAGVDEHCHVRKVLADGSFFHDCAIEHGASGGPMLSIRINGEQLTEDNDARFRHVDWRTAKVQYEIVGVITAEVKRRERDGFQGYFGDNAPFFGDIFGDDLPEAANEYSDKTPNVGNAAKNFASAVADAIAEETRGSRPVRPVTSPRDRDDDGFRGIDEGDNSAGPFFFHLNRAH